MTRPLVLFLSALALITVSLPSPARAQQSRDPRASTEFYLGLYVPEGLGDDLTDFTFGIRGGMDFSDGWGWEGSLGSYAASSRGVDLEATFLDLSVTYRVNPGRRAAFHVFGGIGYADATAESFGLGADAASVTAHGGLALKGFVTPRVYLRPDVRIRWFEDCDESCYEWEATLAVGFRF